MTNLIRAELLKLRTVRTYYWYALSAVAFVPLAIAIAISNAGASGGSAPLDSAEGIRNVMAAASSGTVIMLLLGILVMAGEFRHNTATSTFLITPDRKRVVGAKLATVAIVGVGVAILASAVTLAVALPWLAAKGVSVSVFSSDVWLVLLAAIVATALNALGGVGIGTLIRNQTTAVTVALVWVLVVESLLVSFAPAIGKWLPGGAASALTSVATAHGGLLPMWAGGLLFAAYGLAFAAAGARFVMRRDIT
jgi:hypothetical protein